MKKIIWILIVIMGCSVNPETSPKEPVVQGVWFTLPGPEGPTALEKWANPQQQIEIGECPDCRKYWQPYLGTMEYFPPYENPANRHLFIYVKLQTALHIEISIQPLRGPRESESAYTREYGFTERVFIDAVHLPRGAHDLVLELIDRNGNRLPEGFYRVYLNYQWWDIYTGEGTWRDMIDTINQLPRP